MRTVLLLTLLLSQAVHARQSWIERACERLLLGGPAKPTASLLKIQTQMEEVLFKINRSSQHRLNATTVPLEAFADRPLGLEIVPQANAGYKFVRPVELSLVSHPSATEMDWSDEGKELSHRPSLVMLFENVPVKATGREVDAVTLIQEEYDAILARNPELKVRLRLSRASEITGVNDEHGGRMAAWLEGEIPNYKAKRMMLLMLDTVFAQLANDPRYATKTDLQTKH